MDRHQPNTVTGCMAFSGTKHRAHAIGRAGMERQRSNCALAVCCTMKMPTAVTGLRM